MPAERLDLNSSDVVRGQPSLHLSDSTCTLPSNEFSSNASSSHSHGLTIDDTMRRRRIRKKQQYLFLSQFHSDARFLKELQSIGLPLLPRLLPTLPSELSTGSIISADHSTGEKAHSHRFR